VRIIKKKIIKRSEDKKEMIKYIEEKVLKESILANHFQEYEQENIERCSDCGSSIFRIYNEPVKEGKYEQMVCAKCNHRVGGWLNDFKVDGKGVDGKICRKCGDSLERVTDDM